MFWKRVATPKKENTGKPKSLGARLVTWYILSSFAVLVTVTCMLYFILLTEIEYDDDQILGNKLQTLQHILTSHPLDMNELYEVVGQKSHATVFDPIFIRVFNKETKQVIAQTTDMEPELTTDIFGHAPAIGLAHVKGKNKHLPNGKLFRTHVAEIRAANPQSPSGPTWIVQMAMDETDDEHLLAEYRTYILAFLGGSLLFFSVTGYFAVGKALRPIAQIVEQTRLVHSSTLNQRFEFANAPAELVILGNTYNEMLDRLEEAFARIAQFSNDLSHELRSPLNNVRGEAEVALSQPRSPEEYQEVLSSILEETIHLSRMVNSLLFIAKADNPSMQISKDHIIVRKEIERISDFYEAAANESGLRLETSCAEDFTAVADATLLRQALGNLLDNAIRHTKSGGMIFLTARKLKDTFVIEVGDTGCGIAPEHLNQVFERFFRVDSSRTLTKGHLGLGLSLVKSIVNLHNGKTRIVSEMGQGTQISLEFPLGLNGSDATQWTQDETTTGENQNQTAN